MPATAKTQRRGAKPKAASRADSNGDRRVRLLEVGEELFTRHRFEDVSAEDIAKRASVAHGLMFHYFGSKRAFYFAVLQHATVRSRERLEANTVADPKRWIRKELDIFLAQVAHEEQVFAELIRGSLGAEREAQEIVTRERDAVVERILAKLAPERTSSLLRIAIGAWVAAATDLAAQWVESGRRAPKRHIHAMLLAALNAMLQAAAADSGAKFDPDCFV